MGTKQCFRVFFAWDYEREEAWINRMSRDKGWHLKRVGFCRYVFEEGERGAYCYRLELLRRLPEDAAEKQYLRTVQAEEVCRNGDWGYYRLRAAEGPFASYSCAASKLAYLKGLYRWYLAFGTAVYGALLLDMAAFRDLPPAVLHTAALAALALLALGYTVGLTRYHLTLRRLKETAAAEQRR